MSTHSRVATELAVVLLGAAFVVFVMPHRPLGVDIALALVGLAFVGLSWRFTRDQLWRRRPPAASRARSTLYLLLGTVAVATAFGVIAGLGAARDHRAGGELVACLFRPTFFVALICFVPWALLQQTLVQYYLLARLTALFPSASALLLSAVNGGVYAAMHIPDWEVTGLALPAGMAWSYVYCATRSLPPIALSHALLAVTYYYWIRDRDLVLEFLRWL